MSTKYEATMPDKSYFITITSARNYADLENKIEVIVLLIRTDTIHTSPSFISARAGLSGVILYWLLGSWTLEK